MSVEIIIRDFAGFELASRMLATATERGAYIAICGPVYCGKTTLLQRLAGALKSQGKEIVYLDFGSVVENSQNPNYVLVDHLSSPEGLTGVKEKYPNTPLLAVLYYKPESGFDVIVEIETACRINSLYS